MSNFITKFLISKKRKTIVVFSQDKGMTSEFIRAMLSRKFQTKKLSQEPTIIDALFKEILILEGSLQKTSDFIKLTKSPILVLTKIDKEKDIVAELLKSILVSSFVIANFDDQTTRSLFENNNFKGMTFGCQEGADILASDIRINSGINFKINYRGNTIPIWLPETSDQTHVYGSLAAICIGIILGLNLVEISEALKNCKLKI